MMGTEHEARYWLLLANHFDPSLMRNHAAFHLSSQLVFQFTPISYFVHLYVNGEYMGVYELTEERDAGPGRNEVTFDPDPTLSEYIIEMSWHPIRHGGVAGVDFFMAGESLSERYSGRRAYRMRYPHRDDCNGHFAFAQQFIDHVSRVILSEDWETIQTLIDIPSFIDFYILQELLNNADVFRLSVFMTMQREGAGHRLFMGPVWDFDQSSGTTTGTADPRYRSIIRHGRDHYWLRTLMQMPEFFDLAAARWEEVKDTAIPQTIAHIQSMAITYQYDFDQNFERHPIFEENPSWSWVNPYIWEHTSFMAQIEFLVNYLEERARWMDDQFHRRIAFQY